MSTDAGGEPAAPPPAFSAGRIDAANGILTFPTAFHRTLPPASGPADEDGFGEPPPRLVVVLEQYALPAHALKWAPPFELATTVRGVRALAKPPVATSY